MRPPRLDRLPVTAFAALFALCAHAAAQEAPEFFLDLDTGGHRATIRDLAIAPDGETLVSASDDKTIRVWDWRSGVTLRTIRGQIGPGNEGKVHAIDIAPDGQTLAAGGYFGPGIGDRPPYGDVRLFDLRSGRLVQVLGGHDYAVHDLDFSPDGTLLAAGGGDGIVRIWQQPSEAGGTWTEAREPLDADSWRIERLGFVAGGSRLVALTQDNGLRLWDVTTGDEVDVPDAEELRDVPLQALAVSPDGGLFATSATNGRLHLWDAAGGTLVRELDNLGFRADAIAFAGDGRRLVVNCGYRCGSLNRSIVVDTQTGDIVSEYRGHDGSVTAVLSMSDGTRFATAGGTAHEIHIWDTASGTDAAILKGDGKPITAVAIDSAAAMVAWGTENPCPDAFACPEAQGSLSHQLRLPSRDRSFENPKPAAPASARLRRAVHENDGVAIHAVAGGEYGFDNAVLGIVKGGIPVEAIENGDETGFVHASYTLLSAGGELVTGGGDGTLIAYNTSDGTFAGEFLGGHTGAVGAMAEAPEARMLITGSADQTLRLWNLVTRELVVSMFFTDTGWIIWTPQGYFTASGRMDGLVGWHVNQGQDREARFVRAQQLREHLHSPEIVRRAIILGSASEAARELRGTDSQLGELLERRPPEFAVRLAEGVTAPDGFVAVEILGAPVSGAQASEFSVLANDRRVDQFASRSAGGRTIIEVPLEDGQTEILITGRNDFGYVTERGVKALSRRKAGDEKRGKLYVIAVGVEDYPLLPSDCNGRSCDLSYPVDDAAEFLRVIAERTAPLYTGMEALVMVNRDALEENRERAALVERIAGHRGILDPDSRTVGDEIVDFLDLPGPDDTTILFIAGHGINIDEDYYFIPTDGRKQDGDRWRRSSLVDWSDIQKAVERARGRRIMVLDTCHAANAFNPRLEKEAADARIVVFSATAANNTAEELPELGHGVFTWSLLEGLKGAADNRGDGVRVFGLVDYVSVEVERLSRQRQQPFFYTTPTTNFLLAKP